MVPRYAMSLRYFFSFVITCMAMSIQAELTKVPLRPYLRGNPGLLPKTISSHEDISVVKGVEDCKGQTGCLLKDGVPMPELISIAPLSEFVDIAPLSDLVSPDRRFPFEALINQKSEACPENKDDSDTENDDEDDDGDAEDQDDDDDANDEDFSCEQGGDHDDDDEGDPKEDPAANGNEGSDDDDENGDDKEGDDGKEEEDEDDEEVDGDQPPAKKRK